METNLRGGGGEAVDEEKRKAGNFRGNLSSCDRPGPSWWNDNEGIGTKTTNCMLPLILQLNLESVMSCHVSV